MGIERQLGVRFSAEHPDDVARFLDGRTPREAAAFLKDIEPAVVAELMTRMNLGVAAECLSLAESNRAREIIEALPPKTAVMLLRRLEPTRVRTLLRGLSRSAARSLERLHRYPAGTAGALANPRALSFTDDMTAEEARRHLRRTAGEARYYLYVADREHHLVGVLSIRELFLARASDRVSSVMRENVVSLPANLDMARVAAHPAWREFDVLPVVDGEGVLLGVLSNRQLRQLADTRPTDALGESLAVLLGLADLYWKSLAGLSAVLVAKLSEGNESKAGG